MRRFISTATSSMQGRDLIQGLRFQFRSVPSGPAEITRSVIHEAKVEESACFDRSIPIVGYEY